MSHGAVILEERPAGGWFWEFATEVNDGVSFFAPGYPMDDVVGEHQRKRWIDWTESFVRSVGPFGRAEGRSEFARYQPTWEQPFTAMCDQTLLSDWTAIVTPLEATDDDAQRIAGYLIDLARELGRAGISPRPRFGRILRQVPLDRWAYLLGEVYETYASILLTADPASLSTALGYLPSDRSAVRERW